MSRHDFRWRSNAHLLCFYVSLFFNESHENKVYRINFIFERKKSTMTQEQPTYLCEGK